jgi:4-amino-4-deoxy-L-arabinose transferase-like glycosyltransferase
MTTATLLPEHFPLESAAPRQNRSTADAPAWARPALFALLALTALLYLWDLSASGYANSFYAAATQAGTHSWKAWFFGSLDSGNSITVDKPPAALWVMGLSARILGFNSWSLLAPQALEGVAAVGLLYGAVRRIAGPVAGLVAGAALALTPAAVLMFRFNNPDALLTLLLVASAYAVTRALEAASSRWLMLAGTALGFAFLTKMLQGFLVLPAFALVYLIAAPTSLRRRIGHTLLAGVAVLVSAGWWVAAVALWPASARPYIGGSTNNSVLNLVFGYNGLGRLFGSTGQGGGGAAGSSFGGSTGLTRLFGSEMGNEISWLLPAALVALAFGLWVTRHAPRTDRTRAALMLWGGWLLASGLVFSYMKGVIHPYYTVALAPAIAALVAIGGRELWGRRDALTGRLGLAAIVVAAGGWSFVLLVRVPDWHPSLRWTVALASAMTVAGVLVPVRRLGRAAVVVAVAGVLAGLLGTSAFAAATASSPHTGSIPSVGPAVAQTSGVGGGGSGMNGRGATSSLQGGGTSTGTRPAGLGANTSGSAISGSGSGTGGSTSSTALTTALKATTTTWAAATVGDQSAAELELSSGKAVIAIGGWSGTDASPTLAQFKQYVAEGKVRYFISGNGQGGGQSSGVASEITAWVTANFTATTIGGQTVYDLTSAAGS